MTKNTGLSIAFQKLKNGLSQVHAKSATEINPVCIRLLIFSKFVRGFGTSCWMAVRLVRLDLTDWS